MSTQRVLLTLSVAGGLAASVPARVRNGSRVLWEGGQRLARSLVAQLRPGPSLAAGSLLVLLTLFLPIGYMSCSPHKTGYEMVTEGKGTWPSLLGLVIPPAGRVFYMASLLFAALTLVRLFLAWLQPGVWQKPQLIRRLYLVAGTLLFIVAGDFFVINAPFLSAGFLEWLGLPEIALSLLSAAVPFFVLVRCLRSAFLRRILWAKWLLLLGLISSLLYGVHDFLQEGWHLMLFPGELSLGLILYTCSLFWLVPLLLWYRLGQSSRPELRTNWLRVKRRLVGLYVLAIAFNLACYFVAGEIRALWGWLPYFVGVHLLAIGYRRLEQGITRAPTQTAIF